MEVLLKGGPVNGATVHVKHLAPNIVIDQNSESAQAHLKVPADLLYELASAADTPVYVFKAFLTID